MAGSITLTSNGRDFTCKTLDKAVQAIIDGGKNWTEVHLVDMTLEISGDCEDVWDTLEYWIWTVQNLAVEMALTRLVVRDLKARKTDGTTIVLPLVWCKYSSMYKYVPNKPEIEGEWFQCRDYGFEAYGPEAIRLAVDGFDVAAHQGVYKAEKHSKPYRRILITRKGVTTGY